MAGDNATVEWLEGLVGLNDSVAPGSKKQAGLGISTFIPETNDLKNVQFRFGNITGRGGLSSYQDAVASLTMPIIGLFSYNRTQETPNSLLRVTPTKLELLSGSTWIDKTGSTLGGIATTRPQYTLQNDILIYTMEGRSPVQGYGTNSGVAVNFTTGTNLTDDVPYAKSVISYFQFLLLGNFSLDGSFTDVFDGWRSIIYSDHPFSDWTGCGGNVIDLYQTPGTLVRMMPLGRSCICYKDDGVIRLTYVGQAVRFTQELIPESVGCAAPLSVVNLGALGHVYLGTNGILYNVQPNAVRAISYEKLSQTLPPALSLQKFRYARGFCLPTRDLYILLYDRTGLAGQFLNSYVTWNYRTGEFSKGELGVNVIAAEYFRPVDDTQEVGLISSSDKVLEVDSSNKSDDGVPVERYWTSGWQQMSGSEEGWLFGVIAEMRKAARGRIKISVARNFNPRFEREQTFKLKGLMPGTSKDRVECNYRFPSPVWGSWFNVKITFYHDGVDTQTELFRIGFIGKPKHKYPVSQQQVVGSE